MTAQDRIVRWGACARSSSSTCRTTSARAAPSKWSAASRSPTRSVNSSPTPRDYDHIVATKDFHIDPGDHFSDNPDFSASWPPHCVVGTPGADFHPEFDPSAVEAVFTKGRYSAAYSGFEGTDEAGTPLGGLAAPTRRRRSRHRRHRHRLLRGGDRDRRGRRRFRHPGAAGPDRGCGTGDQREGGRARCVPPGWRSR